MLLLKELSLSFINDSDFEYHKDAFYLNIIQKSFNHQGPQFNLLTSLSIFPSTDEEHATDHVSLHERILIKLLVATDNEELMAQAIQLLETAPIHCLDWIEKQYDGKAVVELTAIQGNSPLIQYLLKRYEFKPPALNHLLKTAIDASQWETVKQLIYLTGVHAFDIESIKEALVAATKEGQLKRVLHRYDASPTFFSIPQNKTQLPADPTSLLQLLSKYGEVKTIEPLIKLLKTSLEIPSLDPNHGMPCYRN